jgi:L-threonylcarbamoyladenylate synthase
LDGQVDVVLDGGSCKVGVESTVVDARGRVPVVLREGAVTREQLGLDGMGNGYADFAASPGIRHHHYAPRCRVEIAPVGQGPARATALARNGAKVGLVASGEAGPSVCQLAHFTDAAELGRLLYRALRAAEDADVDVVVIEAVPLVGMGRAVMDRVRRAAAG